MQDQILTEAELSDELLDTPLTAKIVKALLIYALLITIGTALCIWFVDFRAKGTFSTIRGENISKQNSQ